MAWKRCIFRLFIGFVLFIGAFLSSLFCDFVQRQIFLFWLEREGFSAELEHFSLGIFSSEISLQSLRLSRENFSVFIEEFSGSQEKFLGFLPGRLALNSIKFRGTYSVPDFSFKFTNLSKEAENAQLRANGHSVFSLYGTGEKTDLDEFLNFKISFSSTKNLKNPLSFICKFSLQSQAPAHWAEELEPYSSLNLSGNIVGEFSGTQILLSPAEIILNGTLALEKNQDSHQELCLAELRAPMLKLEQYANGNWFFDEKNAPIRLFCSEFPLACLNPFLRDYKFSTGDLNGELFLDSDANERHPSCLTLKNCTLSKQNDALLKNLSGEVLTRFTLSHKKISADFSGSHLEGEISKFPGREFSLDAQLCGNVTCNEIKVDKFSLLFSESHSQKQEIFSLSCREHISSWESFSEDFSRQQFDLAAKAFPLEIINSLYNPQFFFYGNISGTAQLNLLPTGMNLSATNGFSFEELSLQNEKNESLLSAPKAKLEKFSLKTRPNSLSLDFSGIKLKQNDASKFLQGDLNLHFESNEIKKIKINLYGKIDILSENTYLKKYLENTTGTLDFKCNLSDKIENSFAELELENLHLKNAPEIGFKHISIQLNPGQKSHNDDVARMRIQVHQKENSDIRIKFSELSWNLRDNFCLNFKGRALAPLIEIDDFLLFSQFKKLVPESKKHPKKENITQAPWENFSGELDFKISKLHLPKNISIEKIEGGIVCNKENFTLLSKQGHFYDGNILAKLKFSNNKSKKTIFDAGLIVENAQIDKLITSSLELENPILTGKLNAQIRLHSESLPAESLSKNLSAECKLSAHKGELHLLSKSKDKTLLNTAVEAGTRLGSGLAGTLGNFIAPAAPALGTTLIGGTELIDYLRAFPYDSISMEFVYHPKQSALNIGSLALRSEHFKLYGNGIAQASETLPLLDWPLELKLEIGVHGAPAHFFQLAGFTGTEDSDGFLALPPLQFSGPLTSVPERISQGIKLLALPK